jgi:hypothetical protein
MRSNVILRCVSAVCFMAFLALFCAAPSLLAQGSGLSTCSARR